MTPDEFRNHGREVIDWIADYMERVEQLPVLSQVKPGEIRSRRDRGIVVILDPRVRTKPYGRMFLASLPKCRQVVERP